MIQRSYEIRFNAPIPLTARVDLLDPERLKYHKLSAYLLDSRTVIVKSLVNRNPSTTKRVINEYISSSLIRQNMSSFPSWEINIYQKFVEERYGLVLNFSWAKDGLPLKIANQLISHVRELPYVKHADFDHLDTIIKQIVITFRSPTDVNILRNDVRTWLDDELQVPKVSFVTHPI